MSGKVIMNRVAVVQKIIDNKKAKTYLEIGVLAGDTFLRIKIRNKEKEICTSRNTY